jgi:hypothetical protein
MLRLFYLRITHSHSSAWNSREHFTYSSYSCYTNPFVHEVTVIKPSRKRGMVPQLQSPRYETKQARGAGVPSSPDDSLFAKVGLDQLIRAIFPGLLVPRRHDTSRC